MYTRVVTDILTSGGAQPIRLPPKSPNLNAYAERLVRSIKEECLTRVIRIGEGTCASPGGSTLGTTTASAIISLS